MNRLNELEQLKKEYQEIPIPEHGIDGVKAAMERARQKKRLRKRMIGYVAGAAAAVLVVAIMPKDGFMMKSANESANLVSDAVLKENFSGGSSADGYYDVSAEDSVPTELPLPESVVPTQGYEDEKKTGVSAESGKDEEFGTLATESAEGFFASAELREKVGEEIERQMKERFPAGESVSDSFAGIQNDQNYYINEEGLLVVVFAPGEIAAKEYGQLEFVIPDEVWK